MGWIFALVLCLRIDTIHPLSDVGAHTVRFQSTFLRNASCNRRILPRPKNMPPACFLNGLSNPNVHQSKNPPTRGGLLLWRRVRDSNPRFLSESPVFKTGSLNRSDNSPYVLNDSILKGKSQGSGLPWWWLPPLTIESSGDTINKRGNVLWIRQH